MQQCTCSKITAGDTVTRSPRDWDDECEIHGVGTQWFRSQASLPYGYADERNTTRDQWLDYKRAVRLRNASRG